MMRPILAGIGVLAFAELALLLLAAGALGGLAVILWCLATGIAGVGLIQRQGLALVARLSRQQPQPAQPAAAVSGALLGLAGLLLLVPGLISDALGLFLVLPWVRRRLTRRMAAMPGAAEAEITIIEGEYRRQPPN